MSKLAKALSSAAGNAGDSLYVEDVFSTYLYTGNGSAQTITNGIDLAGEGGLVWCKPRTVANAHYLADTARGINKFLESNSSNAEATSSTTGGNTGDINAFNSNGFSVGSTGRVNQMAQNFASWTFRKAPGFFDVVTYTGNGTSNRAISHNLGSVPGCMIVKRTDSTGDWYVCHIGVNGTYPSSAYYFMKLNSTAARAGAPAVWDVAPTSTDFTVQPSTTNVSSATYVAYLFAHDAQEFGAGGDESIIKCGSFTSTALNNLGWEPAFVMMKRTDSTSGWFMVDNMRGMTASSNTTTYFGSSPYLYANASTAETAGGGLIAIHANGFASGQSGTYIYIAIRRPMKVPESGTEVFSPVDIPSNSSTNSTLIETGFVTDLSLIRAAASGSTGQIYATGRLRGGKSLNTTSTAAEINTATEFDHNNGFIQALTNAVTISWNFKRAPEFMDVVCWKGDGTSNGSHKPAHGLTVVPQFIISKVRDATDNWACLQSEAVGGAVYIMLNNTTGGNAGNLKYYYGDGTNYVPPTSSVFTVTAGGSLNVSGKAYVSYLFATLAGVSKVGSYTGTAATLNVDCGFTAGARFFLCKRTDATGDWYLWDSARGIVAGNDPYLLLNTTAAEVTNTDYVDPLAAGITLTAAGSSTINVSGGSYIFLAIA